MGICTEYNYDSSDPFRSCAQWANYTNLDDDIITKVDPLTKEEYQGRLAGTYLGWSDDEYLGYSVPDMYPVEGLVVYNFTDGPRLVINGGTHAACVDVANNGDDCNVGDFYGECSEERCWLNPQAGNSDDIYYGLSTRGYTIEESPFPDTVINPTTSEISSNHQQVEICNSDNPSGCETTYQKVSYGLNYSKYIAKGESSSDMVCTEGDPDLLGEDCSTSTDKDVYCQGEMGFGTCSKKTKVETYYNWPGICVEYDKSPKGSNILVDTDAGGSYDRIPNLCTQWYPVESISGTDSLYDNYDEAGYYNADGDLYFCSVGEAYTIPEDLIYCGYFNDNYCNLLMVAPAGSKINIAEFENSYLKHLMKDTIGDIKYQTDTVSSKEVIYPTTGSGRLIPGDASDSRFMREDFNLESGTGDISLESDIEALFDGTLKYYYYDENVKPNATYSGSSYLSVGLTNNNKIICSHNDESEESGFPACDDNKHKVYTKHVYLENGIGGDGTYPGYTPDHKDCPWDEGVYGHKSYCNELNHNYYVYNPEDGVEECNELDCSGPTYGRECMRSKTIYKGYYDSINAGTEDDGTDEYDIVSLIEALTISNDYCSEYDLSGLPESFPDLDISSEIEDCLAATTETDCSTPGSGYTISLSGNTCAGDACYQQCGQVVEVDSIAEHNKTIVRADIWWRSKNNPTSDIVNWSAYAYSSASYGSSALKYSEIGSATILDGNFGAAQDWDNTLPIITEVPVGTVLNNTYYSSSVFFGTEYIVTELKKLFYQVYNLEWSGNSYDHLSTDGLGDIVNSYAGAVYDPKAYKLDCSGGNLCTFGDEGITVEYDQSGNAAIKFYYYAYPDASPIKAIKVDWEGLGYFTGTIGKYKNRIPKCNSDWTMPHSLECTDADDNGICDNPTDTGVDMQGFGGTNDACSEGYKVFQYNYTYSGDPAVECDGTDGKSNKEGTSCYKPQIKIVDWWDQEEIYTSDTWIEVD